MQHLNSNVLCAIDLKTTGSVAGKHDLIQIAIIPLNNVLEPGDVYPFYIKIRPIYPDNAETIKQIDLADAILNGMNASTAFDLFEEWVKKLQLPERKQIIALAHNWVYKSKFIMEWMGERNFSYYFHEQYRDVMVAALYLNDRSNFQTEKPQFPKLNLQYLCSQTCVVNADSSDSLQNALSCSRVYKNLLGRLPVSTY